MLSLQTEACLVFSHKSRADFTTTARETLAGSYCSACCLYVSDNLLSCAVHMYSLFCTNASHLCVHCVHVGSCWLVPEQPQLNVLPGLTHTQSSIRLLTSPLQLCEASSPSPFYVGVVMDAPELQLLFRELSTSSDVCTLIRSIQNSHTAYHPQQFGELPDDKAPDGSEQAAPPDDLLCSARTLFEQCQQMTCTTSDTTLAVKGLTDQTAVLAQVHRCASRRCVYPV